MTYLELFFDLVYVFAATRLSHGLLGQMDSTGVAQTAVLLRAVWWGWSSTSWFTNFFDPDLPSARLVLLGLMLASLVCRRRCPRRSTTQARSSSARTWYSNSHRCACRP
ncbi:low temperature requirement protein A [Streptomyces sp. NPDC050264]|uniref:low temperature requirement protein A n=1 Tax=Streptomyces sp. NPDC050264 TaxID=3155038 RepID=UPI003433513E